MLLQKCVVFCRGVYLARTTPPSFVEKALLEMDHVIEKTFAKVICAMPPSAEGMAQARLSIKLGGLGLRPTHQHARAAYVASVVECATLDGYAAACPELEDRIQLSSSVAMLLSQQGEEHTAGAGEAVLATAGGKDSIQHQFSAKIEARQHKDLLEGIGVGAMAHAPWANSYLRKGRLLSAGADRLAGAWLEAVPSPWYGTEMTADQFRVAVLLRLGEPVFMVDRLCPICGARCDMFGYHATTCKSRGSLGQRHNHIRDVMYGLMYKAQMLPRKEVCFRTGAGKNERPADLLWAAGKDRNEFHAVDLAVTHPLQPKYVKKAALTARAAAEAYGRSAKLDKYTIVMDGKNVLRECNDVPLIPAIAETFGAWHVEAVALFDTIAQGWAATAGIPVRSAKQRVHTRVAVALQRQNAVMILDRRTGMDGADLAAHTPEVPQLRSEDEPLDEAPRARHRSEEAAADPGSGGADEPALEAVKAGVLSETFTAENAPDLFRLGPATCGLTPAAPAAPAAPVAPVVAGSAIAPATPAKGEQAASVGGLSYGLSSVGSASGQHVASPGGASSGLSSVGSSDGGRAPSLGGMSSGLSSAGSAAAHGTPRQALADGDSAWSAAWFGLHSPAFQSPGAPDQS